ncbi:MAG: hypothetical protein IJ960_00775 [Oscillospiraceae bacterium]|nr:hypothetical protein [Oscillospiraceae bacterium]
MAEFRVEKSSGYTVMSNHHLRNAVLSLKAKGLLSLMLSLPDNWDYTLAGLAHISVEGKDAIRAAIQELEQEGYVERRQTRDENGKLAGNEYIIRESPVAPLSENPTTDNPSTEKPLTENPTELIKDISSKDKSEKKSKKEKSAKARKPKPEPLTRAQIKDQIMDWFRPISRDAPEALQYQLWKDLWLYLEHKETLGKPYRDKGGVTGLCNKLMRYSGGDLGIMCEVLETALEHGWQGIHPPSGNRHNFRGGPPEKPAGEEKRWL